MYLLDAVVGEENIVKALLTNDEELAYQFAAVTAIQAKKYGYKISKL